MPVLYEILCVSVLLQHYLCNLPKFWIPFAIRLGEFYIYCCLIKFSIDEKIFVLRLVSEFSVHKISGHPIWRSLC